MVGIPFWVRRPQRADERARQTVANAVAERGQRFESLTDEQLFGQVQQLRNRVQQSPQALSSSSTLAESFALVNEALRRVHGMQFYDVQLLAGQALVGGRIAEMATGEGKTLVQGLAAFALALPGHGVHVMTSNAYLAERDCETLAPVLRLLGLRVDVLRSGASWDAKHQAYQADVTFGAGFEFGFDFLRDQVALQAMARPALGQSYRQLLNGGTADAPRQMQRGHVAAIVDEADSVMIDEATTPLILSSGPVADQDGAEAYELAREAAAQLVPDEHFLIDRKQRQVQLTMTGSQLVGGQYRPPAGTRLHRSWLAYVEQALFARHLLCRDVDYVIQAGKIQLVDQSTGRVFADRTLRNGLHQAVEVREGLPPSAPTTTLGRISRQKYLQLYDSVCGMTGTARGAEREFWVNYGLQITSIPTRKPDRRIVHPPRFFADKQAKHQAIVGEAAERFRLGQPVLIGTRTIDDSLALSHLFGDRRLGHQVLNGVQDADEAKIIAQAGQRGALTIATNIAGRGTDIRLAPEVVGLGGLHVIACEPDFSQRVDRQLFGRCARQGDPGSCQLFAAADDQLLQQFGRRLGRRIERAADEKGEAHADWSRALARLQRRAEHQHYQDRARMLDHDNWIDDVMRKLC